MVVYDDLYRVTNISLKCGGLGDIFLTKGKNKRRILYWIGMANIIFLTIGETAFFKELGKGDDDLKEIFFKFADLTPCYILSTLFQFKTFPLVWRTDLVIALVDEFKSLWPTTKDPDIVKILADTALPVKKLCLFYTILVNSISSYYNALPMITMIINYVKHGYSEILMPYLIWYPYDYNNSYPLFAFTYVSQCFGGIYVTGIMSGIDCLFFIFLTQLCVQLKLLKYNLLHIVGSDFEATEESMKVLKSNFKSMIQHHVQIISLTKKIESVFGPSLFANLLTGSVSMCVSGFSLTICPPVRIMNYLIMFGSATLQILLISWFGNELVLESMDVSNAAYESPWIGTDKDHCFGIVMLQQRSQSPLAITAMGFFNISLSTFSSICKGAWSYFTLMRSMLLKHENEMAM